MSSEKKYQSFAEYYPFYLSEHSNVTCRSLHYAGSSAVLIVLAYALLTQQFMLLIALPFLGYGPAWIGHFIFEKNRPATFQYPLWSFIGDWVMLKDAATGQLKAKMETKAI